MWCFLFHRTHWGEVFIRYRLFAVCAKCNRKHFRGPRP